MFGCTLGLGNHLHITTPFLINFVTITFENTHRFPINMPLVRVKIYPNWHSVILIALTSRLVILQGHELLVNFYSWIYYPTYGVTKGFFIWGCCLYQCLKAEPSEWFNQLNHEPISTKVCYLTVVSSRCKLFNAIKLWPKNVTGSIFDPVFKTLVYIKWQGIQTKPPTTC